MSTRCIHFLLIFAAVQIQGHSKRLPVVYSRFGRLHEPANSDPQARLEETEDLHAKNEPGGVGDRIGKAVGSYRGHMSREEFWQEIKEGVFFPFGVLLLMFAIPLSYFNENRQAKLINLIDRADVDCRYVQDGQATEENRNWLVHLQGQTAAAAAPIEDELFDQRFEGSCLRYRRLVEFYQVVETRTKDSQEANTYHYNEVWSRVWHDSSNFEDATKRGLNVKPDFINPGVVTKDCSRVECGDGFLLPADMVSQCLNFQSAARRIGEKVTVKRGDDHYVFTRFGDLFYWRAGGIAEVTSETAALAAIAGSPSRSKFGAPKVGDVRVLFELVPNGKVSVMALQTASEAGGDRDTFQPFRLIWRGFFGLIEEQEEKKALQQCAKQPREKGSLAATNVRICCFCCAWDYVHDTLSEFLTPQIYCLVEGDVGRQEILNRVISSTWGFGCFARLVCLILTFIAWWGIFRPVIGLLTESIPFFADMHLSEATNEVIISVFYTVVTFFSCLLSARLRVAPVSSIAGLVVVAVFLFYHLNAWEEVREVFGLRTT